MGHACLAPPDAGTVRGELTNWAQAGTCGTGSASPDAGPEPTGLGDPGPEPAGLGNPGPEPAGLAGLGDLGAGLAGAGDAGSGPARLDDAPPSPAGIAAAVAADAGVAVTPITASTASPAGAPMRRVNAGSTCPRQVHPAMRMNPPHARLIQRTGQPLKL